MKFYIQHDDKSALYWMASNLPSNPASLGDNGLRAGLGEPTHGQPTGSIDLVVFRGLAELVPRRLGGQSPRRTESFHYPVMLIDGEDLILVSRMGRDSGNQHDVDTVTFHRIKHFRDLAVDLTPTFPEPAKRLETR